MKWFGTLVRCVALVSAVMGPVCTFGAAASMIVAPEVFPFWVVAVAAALVWGMSWEYFGEERNR